MLNIKKCKIMLKIINGLDLKHLNSLRNSLKVKKDVEKSIFLAEVTDFDVDVISGP